MLDLMLANLKNISYIIILIFIFQLSNMMFGIQLNVIKLDNKFDWQKILKWVAKTVCTLTGTALLVAGLTMFPIIISKSGITISSDVLTGINITVIIGIGASVAIVEAKKAIYNFYLAFIDITKDSTDTKSIIDENKDIDNNLTNVKDEVKEINENIKVTNTKAQEPIKIV